MQGRILKEYQAPCFTEVTITCHQHTAIPVAGAASTSSPTTVSTDTRTCLLCNEVSPDRSWRCQDHCGWDHQSRRRSRECQGQQDEERIRIYIYIYIINVYTSARKADWTVRQGNLMQFRPSWYFDSIDSFGQTSHSSSMNSGWPGEHSWSRKFRVVLSQEPGKSGRPSTTQRQG